jgi:hypothetical protein
LSAVPCWSTTLPGSSGAGDIADARMFGMPHLNPLDSQDPVNCGFDTPVGTKTKSDGPTETSCWPVEVPVPSER